MKVGSHPYPAFMSSYISLCRIENTVYTMDFTAIVSVVLAILTIVLGIVTTNWASKWNQLKSVARAFAQTSEEFSHLAKAVDDALVDDAVSEAEFARIYNEFKETRERFIGLVSAVKTLFFA